MVVDLGGCAASALPFPAARGGDATNDMFLRLVVRGVPYSLLFD
ncbi:hypothetical protein [Burkholderia ambifaria]|jgi:hypothetical protein|nr:hypothetical protein [Burkholderia ambifaria]